MNLAYKNICDSASLFLIHFSLNRAHLALLTSEVTAPCSTGSNAAVKIRRCPNTLGREKCRPEAYHPAAQNGKQTKRSVLDVTQFNAGCASRQGVHKLRVRS